MSDYTSTQLDRINSALHALSQKLHGKVISENEYKARLADLLEFANDQVKRDNTLSKLPTQVLKTINVGVTVTDTESKWQAIKSLFRKKSKS